MRKGKITAKFQSLKRVVIEDTVLRDLCRSKSFGTFEKRAPEHNNAKV